MLGYDICNHAMFDRRVKVVEAEIEAGLIKAVQQVLRHLELPARGRLPVYLQIGAIFLCHLAASGGGYHIG